MTFQQKRLSDLSNIGPAGDLPALFEGIGEESLGNLHWAPDWYGAAGNAYVGTGFFRVEDAPPEPESEAPTRWVSQAKLKQRIPAAKRIAIRAEGKTNPIVEDFLDLLNSTADVNLDDPDLVAGMGYLVSIGKLTADDVAAIRA